EARAGSHPQASGRPREPVRAGRPHLRYPPGPAALSSLVDAEHALGYPGDLDLARDRALVREVVVAAQRGEAAQPAGPARVRRVAGIDPALPPGGPGLAVR